MQNFVGFYWTFPVRWAGFTKLSKDAAEAAKQSRTIAYQRELVRRYVNEEKGRLLDEIVAIEISPDRGTEVLKEDVLRAGRICRGSNATLVYVDFTVNKGWRPHPFINEAVAALGCGGVDAVAVPAEKVINRFDPEKHFTAWAVQNREEREQRRRLVPAALRAAMDEIAEGRGRYGRIAEFLNKRGIPTANGGKVWTAETARKAMQRLASAEPETA